MGKLRKLTFSLLALGAISLASCSTAVQGEKGDTGEQGPAGPKGDQGLPGENGENGATWLTGEGAPNASQGNEGDLYLDTLTGDVYVKSGSSWSYLSNLKGEDGKDGENGQDGQDGAPGVKGDKGDKGEDGEDGKDGASWLTGSGMPSATLGNVGDLYLDTASGDVYLKGEAGWSLLTSLKGEDGQDGLDGVNGEKGDQGLQGDTAWSSTILPSENGYVVPSVGSATENSDITFTIYPATNYYLESLSLDGGKTEVTDVTRDANNVYTYKTQMVEGGFVVLAKFTDQTSSGTFVNEQGQVVTGATVDNFGNVISTDNANAPTGVVVQGGQGTYEEPYVVDTTTSSNADILALLTEGDASSIDTAFEVNGTVVYPVQKAEGLYTSYQAYEGAYVIDTYEQLLALPNLNSVVTSLGETPKVAGLKSGRSFYPIRNLGNITQDESGDYNVEVSDLVTLGNFNFFYNRGVFDETNLNVDTLPDTFEITEQLDLEAAYYDDLRYLGNYYEYTGGTQELNIKLNGNNITSNGINQNLKLTSVHSNIPNPETPLDTLKASIDGLGEDGSKSQIIATHQNSNQIIRCDLDKYHSDKIDISVSNIEFSQTQELTNDKKKINVLTFFGDPDNAETNVIKATVSNCVFTDVQIESGNDVGIDLTFENCVFNYNYLTRVTTNNMWFKGDGNIKFNNCTFNISNDYSYNTNTNSAYTLLHTMGSVSAQDGKYYSQGSTANIHTTLTECKINFDLKGTTDFSSYNLTLFSSNGKNSDQSMQETYEVDRATEVTVKLDNTETTVTPTYAINTTVTGGGLSVRFTVN